MTLQEQCCTLEQGKRLKELLEARGVDIQARFWHMPAKSEVHQEYICYGWQSGNEAPAFNVAELGELLPSVLPVKGKEDVKYLLLVHAGPWEGCQQHSSEYVEFLKGFNSSKHTGYGETEAQARATLLIHLLENDLITFNNQQDGIRKDLSPGPGHTRCNQQAQQMAKGHVQE